MPPKVVEPRINADSFNCPHCGALAAQTWSSALSPKFSKEYIQTEDGIGTLKLINYTSSLSELSKIRNLSFSLCYSCKKVSIWLERKVIYPNYNYEFIPPDDLPDECKTDYLEAVSILKLSPRGSASLLRLCFEKLINTQVSGRGSVNDKIGHLVKEELISLKIQQTMDVLRVYGNNAVHPLEIDMDDTARVSSLFKLIDLLVEKLITEPKQTQELFDGLPDRAHAAIAKRDRSE